MTVKKIYQSKSATRLVVTVRTGERKVFCEFTGGSTHPRIITGSYTTTNPDIQQQLEKCPAFNKTYFLRQVIEEEQSQQVEVSLREIPQGKVIEITPEDEEPMAQPGSIEAVTSLLKARDFMNKEHGIPHSKLKNRAEVESAARELGLEFKNWIKQ